MFTRPQHVDTQHLHGFYLKLTKRGSGLLQMTLWTGLSSPYPHPEALAVVVLKSIKYVWMCVN